MRAELRSLWRAARRWKESVSRRPVTGCLTLSAPTAGTAVSWLPGRLFRPRTSTDRSVAVAIAEAKARTARKWSGGKAWRNSGQVKLYLGGTASKASWRACPDCWPLMTGRPAAVLHKAAGCSHSTEAQAGDAVRILMPLMRSGTGVEELGKLGPQFLCPARGWQRAGCNPTTAARPSPAAASPGSSEVGHSQLTDGAYLT